MPTLPQSLVHQLDGAAYEMNEIFSERGHSIGQAVALDPAFSRTRRPQSSLTLELMSDAFVTATSRMGLNPQPGPGGSVEVLEEISGGYARFRLRRAETRGDELHVKANRASSFGYVQETLLGPDYPFIFAFTIDRSEQAAFFAAEVVAVIEGNPGELVLGNPLELGGIAAPGAGGFQPVSDDELPGFEEEGGEAGSGAV